MRRVLPILLALLLAALPASAGLVRDLAQGTADINGGTISGVTFDGDLSIADGNDLIIDAQDAIYFDGKDNTYITESSADTVWMVAGGSNSLRFTATGISLEATKKIYLDGGSNTYITESVADNFRVVTGGAAALDVDSAQNVVIQATKKLYLDGSGNSYLHEIAADTIEIVAGASNLFRVVEAGGGSSDYVQVGNSSDDKQPSLTIIGDADSDAGGDTSETLTVTLTPKAVPTGATWDFTSTQSGGYTFDKMVALLGPRDDRLYTWIEEFDDEANAVQWESGLQADAWTTGGLNYAAGDVVYESPLGGQLSMSTNNSGDNDSAHTFRDAGQFNTAKDPICEARIKVDDITNIFFGFGLVEGSFDNVDTPDDDIAMLVGNTDQGAANIYLVTNDNNAGAVYDDTGSDWANNTYVKLKFDLTDTEQPRVWINDVEVAAASITGTVQNSIVMSAYLHVQVLAGGPIQRTMRSHYVKCWETY